MSDILRPEAKAAIGASLQTIGRWGLWIQILVGVLPTAALAAYVVGAASGLGRFQLLHLLSLASVGLLVVGIIWFWLYIREGGRLQRGQSHATRADVARRIWTGLFISASSIALSLVVLLVELAYILYRFLEAPQGGVPVIQTDPGASFISALDMLSLVSLNLVVAAEVVVLVLGLMLLHRLERVSGSAPFSLHRPARLRLTRQPEASMG